MSRACKKFPFQISVSFALKEMCKYIDRQNIKHVVRILKAVHDSCTDTISVIVPIQFATSFIDLIYCSFSTQRQAHSIFCALLNSLNEFPVLHWRRDHRCHTQIAAAINRQIERMHTFWKVNRWYAACHLIFMPDNWPFCIRADWRFCKLVQKYYTPLQARAVKHVKALNALIYNLFTHTHNLCRKQLQVMHFSASVMTHVRRPHREWGKIFSQCKNYYALKIDCWGIFVQRLCFVAHLTKLRVNLRTLKLIKSRRVRAIELSRRKLLIASSCEWHGGKLN